MAQPTLVNDSSSCFVTATYLDQNGNGYVPLAVQWKLDDLTNQINVIPWTPIAVPALSNVVQIPAASNAMTNQNDAVERRQVVFQVTAPGGAVKYDEIVYDLLNLFGVP